MAEPQYIPEAPWESPNEDWDTLTVNGKEWPGFVTIKLGRKNKWQDKKSKAKHGAERDFNGADNAGLRILIRLKTKADHDRFKTECLPVIEPIPGKKTCDVLTVGHPVTAARNCPTITIDEVEGPEQVDGEVHYEIEATEQRKLDANNAKGTAGKGTGKGLPIYGQNCGALSRELQEEQEKLQRYERIQNDANKQMARSKAKIPPGYGDKQDGNLIGTQLGSEEQQEYDRANARSNKAAAQIDSSNARINALQSEMKKQKCGQSVPSLNGATKP